MKDLKFILALISFTFLLISCESEKESFEDITTNQTLEETLSISNVKIIDESHGLLKLENHELTFKKKSDLLDFKIGDILIADVMDKAPYGFMKKIKAIKSVSDKLMISTEETSLHEVFEKAEIDPTKTEFKIKYHTDDENFSKQSDGYYRFKASGTGTFFGEFQALMRPDFQFYYQKAPNSITPERLRCVFALDIADFSFKGRIGAQGEAKIPVFTLPPITVTVGLVPIVFVNKINLKAKAKAFAGGTLQATLAIPYARMEAGVDYYYGNWYPVYSANIDWNFHRPSYVPANFRGRLEAPTISLDSDLYGGGFFKFFAEAQAVNDIEYPINFSGDIGLYCTPRVKAGIKAKTFGIENEFSYVHEFLTFTAYEGPVSNLLP